MSEPESPFTGDVIVTETKYAAERPLLVRAVDTSAIEVEGRMVDVRVVPFREVARVADPPHYEPYDEEWLPGCFDHQLNAAHRVHANYEHMQGPANIVGHAVSLRSESDGYHATFKMHKTPQGDSTLELIKDGALPGTSLEARPHKNIRAGSVIQRAKAHLSGLAFARVGAFKGSQVLAVRNEFEDESETTTLDAELLPVDMEPGVVERLLRQGFALPDRYMAHPATDTPAETGTSGDGTRPTGANTTSQEDK